MDAWEWKVVTNLVSHYNTHMLEKWKAVVCTHIMEKIGRTFFKMASPLHFVQPQDCTWAMWPMSSPLLWGHGSLVVTLCFATLSRHGIGVLVPMIWASTRDPTHKKTWNILYIAHHSGEQFQQLPCAILSKQRRFHPLLMVDVLEHIESQLVVHFHLANSVVGYCYLEIL
jgi:hypothetical protein